MKKNYIILFFYLLITFLCAENTDSISVVKFIRQDDYSSDFELYANDLFIGIAEMGKTLSWEQAEGDLTISIKHEEAILPIEISVQSSNLYEIFFKSDSYTVRTYTIESNNVVEKEPLIPFYYIIILLVIVASLLFFIIRNLSRKKHYKIGQKYLDEGKVQEAILLFQSLTRAFPKNLEFWSFLEKSYLINNEFDKAEICKEQIKSLLSHHKMKSIASELPTLKNITDALNNKGFQIAKINMIKKIDKGSSNFGKYLVEVIIKDTFITLFAVIKLPDKSQIHKQNDLLREAAGFQLLRKNWQNLIEKHLPKETVMVSTSESDVLFSYYAEESKTNQVKTLIASLESDFNRTLDILSQIRSMYREKHSSLSIENKSNRSIFLHVKETISEKWSDILNLNWEEFGIDSKKRYIQLHGKLFPNVIFFLQNKKKWNEKSISINYHLLHGDLNPENCMITTSGNFVFIDFEKVGNKPFFYDLAFLSSWILQRFALEKNIQIESVLQIQECIYEFIYQVDETISVSSQLANVYSILQNLLPVREQLEENEQIGFDIAFLCAFVQRAFYELRDSAKEERKLHLNNGLFFYAFACFLLHKFDFVNVSNAKINNAFDFPFPAKK